MGQNSWLRVILESIFYLTALPLMVGLQVNIACRRLSSSTPWKEGRIFPFLSIKVRVDEEFNKRRNRRAIAVCRAYGSPLHISYKELLQEYEHARSCRDALRRLTSVVPLLTTICGCGAAATYAIFTWGDHPNFDPEGARELINVLVIIFSSWAATQRFETFLRRWQKQNCDIEAIISCFFILHLCGDLVRNKARPLEIEESVRDLREELGDFVTSSEYFSEPSRRESVSRHVALVQQELMSSSGTLLTGGSLNVPGVVKTIGCLLERIIQQRWLGLLDLSDGAEPESVTLSPEDRTGKRDAWIVMGGSIAAALGLGVAAAMGVPLSAAVPAALIFLLGPATLWGSRRLGMSPRSLLDSARTSVAGANQAGSQQQGNSQGNGASAASGSSRDGTNQPTL
ncbi:hypothetical protein SAMN04487982_103210 [Streptomyces sp. ok210]|nr:hypothetical protein SAMN04487982_103210 [Streptomyces sp. ok210]